MQVSAPPAQPPALWGPQPPPNPYYAYAAAYWENQRAGKIDNTKTGLLLLMIAALISWVPLIGLVGGVVALIGALLIILAREVFGREHDRNVILSIILFFTGIAVSVVGYIGLFFSALSGIGNPGGAIAQPSFTIWSVVLLIGGGVTGLSEVFFTYALQVRNGRILLWTAYASSIVLSIVNLLLILPLLAGGGLSLYPTLSLTGLLAVAPAVLYGVAFYLARERIVRREIPPPITLQPAMPTPGGIPPTSGR